MDPEKKKRKVFEKTVTMSEKAQEASYLAAELTAEKVKSHATAESIMMRACKITARTVTGKEAEVKLTKFLFLIIILVAVWMTCHTRLKMYCVKH
jgi:hypothetical protein